MKFTIVIACLTTLAGCTSSSPRSVQRAPQFKRDLIAVSFKPGELSAKCSQALVQFSSEMNAQVTNAFDFDRVWSSFNDTIQPLVFMGYVSNDEATRSEASQCEAKTNVALADIFTHRRLYKIVKTTTVQDMDQERLVIELRRQFEKSGMTLNQRKLEKFRKLQAELADLEAQYMKNYNSDTTTIQFAASDLSGVSDTFLSGLQKLDTGPGGPHYVVTTKITDAMEVLMNATSSETRRKMLLAFENRGGAINSGILARAIVLREQIAKIIGFKNWADYRIKGNMAKNSKNVMKMLNDLKSKLAPRYAKERDQLVQAKQQMVDANATQLDPWDVRYLAYQIQKRDYQLDDDVLKQYFPKDRVVAGLFSVYSTLLGLHFKEVKGASVWASDVKLYAIVDDARQSVIGYFYTDFDPRPGKYGHAASFPLILGHQTANGYSLPVSAIVANFNPPTNGLPSLLTYTEVRTLFHEFGHIMHQTLTRAPYGYLSGTNVAQDFVEAPSQMFERWVENPMILRKVSGFYKEPVQPIPDALIAKIIASQRYEHENLPTGYYYMRQLVLALTDMALHTATKPVDPDATYARIHRELLGFDPIQDSHFMASFSHLMNGYDAGYYGYLWSQVYADDMFSEFKKEGLLNGQVGMRFRSAILEQGNMAPALSLISTFLGRQPNNEAFFENLGI